MHIERTAIKVAAIQMNCKLARRDENLAKSLQLIESAVEQGAELIVLPELFNTGYRVEEKDHELAERIPGFTTQWMCEIAKKFNIYLTGAILELGQSKGLVYDTAVFVGPQGFIGRYRKTHLWDSENLRFAKGNDFPVFHTPIGTVGLQICYEVGFPEGARLLALKGADIIVYTSAFGKPRLYAWDLATRARALENGVYIIAANRTGNEKNETSFAGHSRIVDPSGNVLKEATCEDEVIITEIDLGFVLRQRKNIPYLRDLNKIVFYNELLSTY